MEKRSSFAHALFSGSEWFWEKPSFSLSKSKQACLVLFVSDFKQNTENGFETSSLEMLERIIKSMKLENNEFVLAFNLEESLLSYSPKVIVLLGASMTNQILGDQIRLTSHHGQFFEKESFACPLVPIFHPDLMLANPSLKAPAWMDIQKVMKFVGKL